MGKAKCGALSFAAAALVILPATWAVKPIMAGAQPASEAMPVESMAELEAYGAATMERIGGFTLREYWPGTGTGGGFFKWQDPCPVSPDRYPATPNGIAIRPEHLSDMTPYSGKGCLRRMYTGALKVTYYGARTDGSDDTQAFAAALARGGDIYIPAGTYRLNWDYRDGGAALFSNTYLHGDGDRTVLAPYNASRKAIIGIESGSPTKFIENVTIANVKFQGTVTTDGHSDREESLVFAEGVRHLIFDHDSFVGPRMDGICLGCNPAGPANVRHDIDVVVRNSTFNGVLSGSTGGRNAISVIDVDGLVVDRNVFTNWARSDMPGCIDLEPDFASSVLQNIIISNNRFSHCDGNRGAISIAPVRIAAAHNIRIVGNYFADGDAIAIYTGNEPPSVPNDFVICDNDTGNIRYFINKVAGNEDGITVCRNRVNGTGSGYGVLNFGNGTAAFTTRHLSISQNIINSNAPQNIAVSDNLMHASFTSNTMSGATLRNIIIGKKGSAASNVKFGSNDFRGAPRNGHIELHASVQE